MYEPSSGPGLTSPLLFSIGNGSDRTCLATGAYPSATATQSGLAQATLQPSSSAASPSASSNPEEKPSRKTCVPLSHLQLCSLRYSFCSSVARTWVPFWALLLERWHCLAPWGYCSASTGEDVANNAWAQSHQALPKR